MKVLLLLVLAVALLADAAPPAKGLRPKQKPQMRTSPAHPLQDRAAGHRTLGAGGAELQIINGHYADDTHKFPWQALIVMDQTFYCGGSLISSTVVLTAGQCASGYSQFLVNVGDTNRRFHYSDTYQYAYTYKSVVPEDYTEDLRLNDIGLLLLLAPLQLNDAVTPIKLPSPADATKSLVGATATISGFGPTETSSYAYKLKYVSQTIMDVMRCSRFFGDDVNTGFPLVQDEFHICGDGEGTVGACGDDLGGPLVIQEDDGTWKQIGISSFETDAGCKYGYPSVYTRVTAYLDWISKNTKAAP